MGKAMASRLKPSADITEIREWQAETSEAAGMIMKKGSLPLGGIKEITQAIGRAELGGSLSVTELLAVRDFLYVCAKLSNYSKSESKHETYARLDSRFAAIEPIPELEREISRCIISEVEISDDASPALSDIRRGIRVASGRIKDQLNSIIHSQTYKNMLQDSVVTMRNDRYCVPVKAEFRGSFPGMIHDQSGSGATVFIEPMAVVQLNNRIKELYAEEKAEIDKILWRLSGLAAEKCDTLRLNEDVITQLDFIFAKAEISIEMNGTEPVFNENGYINIKKGRHPLLDPQAVVPTDISLGGEYTALLITGPNTGGKTVALKTLGLLTLMGQAGLHISAFDNSELAVFDHVFADIGDEQSIEQSLSTFSSHMTNIVKILENLTDNSLVLLDELGAGTDPVEGAALAIAILRTLHERGIRTAVTTHYSELKLYALSTPGVENASCEFNVETLRPTYKLLIGIPGKSNAFAISQKLGLPEAVIAAAKELLSQESVKFEDVLTDLEISRRTVAIEQERAEGYRLEAERLSADLEERKKRLAEQREKILGEAREEAKRLLYDTKEESDRLIKELLRQNTTKGMEETRQKIRDRLGGLNDSEGGRDEHAAPENLAKGDRVFIRSMNQSGVVTSPPDTNGQVTVQAGIMKIMVSLSDLALDTSEETVKVGGKSLSGAVKSGKSLSVSHEIDLRGCMPDEAIERLSKYLDDAYLAGLRQTTVIHGKGTGALRTAVQAYLKKHPHIKSYRLGSFGEGENGVTIAEFRG